MKLSADSCRPLSASWIAGKKIFTESGGMCWMEEEFSMDSNTRGGLLKGLGRAMSGESIF